MTMARPPSGAIQRHQPATHSKPVALRKVSVTASRNEPPRSIESRHFAENILIALCFHNITASCQNLSEEQGISHCGLDGPGWRLVSPRTQLPAEPRRSGIKL